MSYSFPSEPWTAAFKDAINQNPEYRKHGAPWTFGSVAMVVEANPSLGLEQTAAIILDVHQGSCQKATFVEGMEAVDVADPAFVIVADYARWKLVVQGDLDPIKGMMEGKLKLTKGHLPTMIRFVHSSRALVTSAKDVPTEYLD